MDRSHGLPRSPFDNVPDEILDLIISHLEGPAPSGSKVYNQPFYGLTESSHQPLKQASCVSVRWRDLAFPRLFRFVRLRIGCDGHMDKLDRAWEIYRFARFFQRNGNLSQPASFAMEVQGVNDGDTDSCASRILGDQAATIWPDIFGVIRPMRLTILAPPHVLKALTNCRMSMATRYSFHMPYHILSLSQPHFEDLGITPDDPEEWILQFRWQSALFNEGSFNRALGEYDSQGDSLDPPSVLPALVHVFKERHVRHITYVAINPTWQYLATLFYIIAGRFDSFTIQWEPGPEGVINDQWQGAWLDEREVDVARLDKVIELIRILDRVGPLSPLTKFEVLRSNWDLMRLWAQAHFGSHKMTQWKPASRSVLVRDESCIQRENPEFKNRYCMIPMLQMRDA